MQHTDVLYIQAYMMQNIRIYRSSFIKLHLFHFVLCCSVQSYCGRRDDLRNVDGNIYN